MIGAKPEQLRTLADLVERYPGRWITATMRDELWVVFDEQPGKLTRIRRDGSYERMAVVDAE